jgi:hypothetical protein
MRFARIGVTRKYDGKYRLWKISRKRRARTGSRFLKVFGCLYSEEIKVSVLGVVRTSD